MQAIRAYMTQLPASRCISEPEKRMSLMPAFEAAASFILSFACCSALEWTSFPSHSTSNTGFGRALARTAKSYLKRPKVYWGCSTMSASPVPMAKAQPISLQSGRRASANCAPKIVSIGLSVAPAMLKLSAAVSIAFTKAVARGLNSPVGTSSRSPSSGQTIADLKFENSSIIKGTVDAHIYSSNSPNCLQHRLSCERSLRRS
jgi:hypothetical protein